MIRTSTTARARTMTLALLLAATVALAAAGLAHAVPTPFLVTNTNDTGPGSLRQAMTDANANGNLAEVDTINFLIPTTDTGCNAATGVCTISPASALPDIIQAVTMDGYTQTGASPNTLAVGSDAQLKIELDGTNALAANGIRITGPNSTVKGLIINRWDNNNVQVTTADANGNRIEGNFIGTNASGTATLGSSDDGVEIRGATNNVVGGTSAAARNVISGSSDNGVFVADLGATGNRIEGNYIGTDKNGTADLGNGDDGVFIEGAPDNMVGGTSAGARNVISENEQDGVTVQESDATGNRILRNSIFDNDRLGINLDDGIENASGVTTNDAGDADTGPNNLQNYPIITSATTSGGTTTVQGTLNSTPNDTFNLQFFSSPQADPSGFGEGETFAGQTNVTTNAGGNTTFEFTTAPPVAGGRVVTATATNTITRDTSEFSEAVEVEANTPPPPPQPQCSDGADNDMDGRTDFGGANADPGCTSATDDSESPNPSPPPSGCTITGTPGNDTLTGTSDNDTICALGGDDRVDSGSGNDTVRGGPGKDAIAGEAGSDVLYGEGGNDALNARDGVKGNDTANGGEGKDTCTKDKKDTTASC